MKRLAGTTLAERLARATASSLRELLRAFVDVCHAIDFAHTREVVHRDLKPANVMLGEYGEVYVLDWGVARVLARTDTPTPVVGTPSLSLEAQTQAGALLGTLGYMAPEQARGADVDTSADIPTRSACILFELLHAGEPLHPRGDALAHTLATPTEAPSRRNADVAITAPELDEGVRGRARARARGTYPKSRRGRARPRACRPTSTAIATSTAAPRWPPTWSPRARAHAGHTDGRAAAIRDAGRALALHPESTDATDLVMALMTQPPDPLPPVLVRRLADADVAVSIQAARLASFALFASVAVLPLLMWAGVENAWLVGGVYVLLGVIALHAHRQGRRGYVNNYVPLVLGSVALGLLSRMLSPFIIVPVALCGAVAGLGGQPQLLRRPLVVAAAATAAFAVPIAPS